VLQLHTLNLFRQLIVAIGAVGMLLLVGSFFFARQRREANGSRFSLSRGKLYFATVWIFYCILAFLLAGWSATAGRTSHPLSINIWLIIGLVAVGAWLGLWFALAGSPYLRPRSIFRHIVLVILSFTAVMFGTFVWLVFALNIFGA
jgi:hypothetical protein